MYVEKRNSEQDQPINQSTKQYKSEDCANEVNEHEMPSQFLSVKNYTTVQLPKPYQTRVRTSTPDDLKGIMSIMEDYTPEASMNREIRKNRSRGAKANEENDKINKTGSTSRRQFSVAHLAKLSQPKHKNERKTSVNTRSNFVVRARTSSAVTIEPPKERHTPKLNREARKSPITPTRKQNESVGATSRR